MFKLSPIYDIKAVFNIWPELSEDVEEVLKYTNGDSSLAKVFNDVMSGKLLLWIGYNENGYVGFCTTRIDDIPTCYRSLSLVHVFVKDVRFADIMLQCDEEMLKFAKKTGCDILRMWTIRDKAFERVLKPLGWKIGYSEFVKEVV